MHLLLTDHLTCPRCGPEFGLILLADRMAERRVLEGRLGCPNCRQSYPVVAGVADLRTWPVAPPPPLEAPPPAPAEPEETLRLAALLGITEGPARVLVGGGVLSMAPLLSSVVPELEALTVEPAALGWPEASGLSRLLTDGRGVPLRSRSLSGVALGGEGGGALLEEGARLVGSGGRLVFLDAPAGTGRRLMDAGLGLLLEQSGAVVALRR